MRHIETLAVPRDARILWGQLIGSKTIPRPVRAVALDKGTGQPWPHTVAVYADPHDLTRFYVSKWDRAMEDHVIIGMIEVVPCGWLAWTPMVTDDEPPALAPFPEGFDAYTHPGDAVRRVLKAWEWCQRTLNNDWPAAEEDEDQEDEAPS